MGYSFAQVNDRSGLIAMCVIFSITSTTAVVLRFYARKCKGLRFQADDWLIAASLVSAYHQGRRFPAGIWLTKFSTQVFVLGLNAMFLAGMNHSALPTLQFLSLIVSGCVQNVITGHSPVVDDWPVTTETEHMAEKVYF